MGGKKKNTKEIQQNQKQCSASKESIEEKKFVNLLQVYTIYKQKFRRLSKEEFQELLCQGCKGKRAAIELCKEFMRSKQVPNEVNFDKNIGFLSVPRLMPLIGLLAERAGYEMIPSLVCEVCFDETPVRFQKKFAQLLVWGFWFLGRVITDSLSVKEQVNRGNMFNFEKGDMGFWWAGVRILDWNFYAHVEHKPEKCVAFLNKDPPKYRLYTNRAIVNMHQHPLYFLSEEDWRNYNDTVKYINHKKVQRKCDFVCSSASSVALSSSDYDIDSYDTDCDSFNSEMSSLSMLSVNTLASRESID